MKKVIISFAIAAMCLCSCGNNNNGTKQAEGEAEAILKVQQAKADGLKMLNEAHVEQAVLTLQAYEAMIKVADGKATKIIIPSELQSIAGLATAVAESVKETKTETKTK